MNSVLISHTPIPVSSAPLLALLIRNQVYAGFPSPAEDLGAQRIDLTQMLITHAQATYFLRARGNSMEGVGIFDNDILVVDRAVKPRHNHIVVAVVDGDFTVKQFVPAPWANQVESRQPDFCRHCSQGGSDPGSLGCGHQQHQAVQGLRGS
jgi:DNA polymerase V